MKKLLVITYYWPPSGGAGVQRWLKFVKYLREFDWEPVVYTPENPEFPEIDTSMFRDVPENLIVWKHPVWEPYSAYKKLLGYKKDTKISAGFLKENKKKPFFEDLSVWIRGNVFIPDARMFWIKPSVKFLKQKLGEFPVDAISSSGPPHSCHLIALQLNRELNLPWIADFRDPWTHIDFYKDLKLSHWANQKHQRLEKDVLKSASRVVVISPSMAGEFNEIYPRHYDLITNGYDEDDYHLSETVIPDKKFSLAHIGSLVPSRNPSILWKTLQKLSSAIPGFREKLEIKLVGKVDHSVLLEIESAGLSDNLNKIEYLPHDEVVKVQMESQVLLLLINQTPNSKGILTGKFFEYMACKRPILCIGPEDGDAAAILEKTGSGLISDFNDTQKLSDNILKFYELFLKNELKANSSGTTDYSRKQLTKALAEILDTMI